SVFASSLAHSYLWSTTYSAHLWRSAFRGLALGFTHALAASIRAGSSCVSHSIRATQKHTLSDLQSRIALQLYPGHTATRWHTTTYPERGRCHTLDLLSQS